MDEPIKKFNYLQLSGIYLIIIVIANFIGGLGLAAFIQLPVILITFFVAIVLSFSKPFDKQYWILFGIAILISGPSCFLLGMFNLAYRYY